MIHVRNYGLFLTLLATVLALSACGIKPGKLDAQASAPESAFPKSYPAPDTASR